MAPQAKLKQLSLDSNVPLDLAEGLEVAHVFREELLSRGYSLLVPPTVVIELAHLAEKNDAKAELAMRALQSLREWSINPFDLIPTGHGITQEFVRRIMQRGLLPDTEFNDGAILAETALVNIPALVTSDRHLLNIEEADLQIELDAACLGRVSIVHPGRLLKALG